MASPIRLSPKGLQIETEDLSENYALYRQKGAEMVRYLDIEGLKDYTGPSDHELYKGE